jgi:hypothetical protein
MEQAVAVVTAAAVRLAFAATAAVAAVASDGRVVFSAQQGDADHREEHRDAESQCTIHPNFLH